MLWVIWVYLGSFWLVSDVSLAEEDDVGKISIPYVLFAHLRGNSGIAWTCVGMRKENKGILPKNQSEYQLPGQIKAVKKGVAAVPRDEKWSAVAGTTEILYI